MRRHRDVVAVIGSTGTGKSQLAVDLARHAAQHLGMHAEAISADSMQTYVGLDVITNKADASEMEGIPHHLLSFLSPGQEYDITQFVADAGGLCAQLQQQGALPIVVGGTTYYVQHLLFPGRLVSQVPPTDYEGDVHARIASLPPDLRALWDALGDDPKAPPPPGDLWPLLAHLDLACAQRWHHRDHRKVYRSLRILRDTGVPQSAWLSAQDEEDRQHGRRGPSRRLVLWVWSEREALHARLNARIQTMIERGLLDEIRDLRRIAGDAPTDYTRGIFQAIGSLTRT